MVALLQHLKQSSHLHQHSDHMQKRKKNYYMKHNQGFQYQIISTGMYKVCEQLGYTNCSTFHERKPYQECYKVYGNIFFNPLSLTNPSLIRLVLCECLSASDNIISQWHASVAN